MQKTAASSATRGCSPSWTRAASPRWPSAPPHRRGGSRGGVAGQLLDVFIRFAEGSGLAFLTLEVRESNYAAIALYGSRGFRGEGRRKNYYDHPKEDAIIMTKEFGAAEAEAQQ